MPNTFLRGLGHGALFLTALGACAPDPVESDSVAAGRAIYERNCLQCHGTAGSGGGPASLGLGAAPPPLRTLKAENLGVFPREYIAWVVRGQGGLAAPDAAMPDFSRDGFDASRRIEGHIAPRPTELGDLLDYLESIQE